MRHLTSDGVKLVRNPRPGQWAHSLTVPRLEVHMLDETMELIKAMVPGATKIGSSPQLHPYVSLPLARGVMSTTGTRESRVYADLMEALSHSTG